jgi:hypothetical protein
MIDLLAIAFSFSLAEYPSQPGKTRLVPFGESAGCAGRAPASKEETRRREPAGF